MVERALPLVGDAPGLTHERTNTARTDLRRVPTIARCIHRRVRVCASARSSSELGKGVGGGLVCAEVLETAVRVEAMLQVDSSFGVAAACV